MTERKRLDQPVILRGRRGGMPPDRTLTADSKPIEKCRHGTRRTTSSPAELSEPGGFQSAPPPEPLIRQINFKGLCALTDDQPAALPHQSQSLIPTNSRLGGRDGLFGGDLQLREQPIHFSAGDTSLAVVIPVDRRWLHDVSRGQVCRE